MALQPGQALFVAACSHTWHFKCIRPIITEHFPLFMCPNCRQDADLEAPVDVESETWEAILRTTDPRTPVTEPGTSRDPQVKMLNFRPIPDLPAPMISHRDLASDMQSLNLKGPNESDRNPASPDRELALSRTLSPGLSPIIENDAHLPRTVRDDSVLATPPIGISRRVRALSATRDGFEDLASLSATPTIDRGPFVYGDMTVNADGSAEATTSNGNIVQLPRESMSEDGAPRGTKPC
jgi:E3 ubiquitin-protein ligase DMA1/2